LQKKKKRGRGEELLWVSERTMKEEPDLCETLKKVERKKLFLKFDSKWSFKIAYF
jgi:hypothetical protein